jgi:hypothetical protein
MKKIMLIGIISTFLFCCNNKDADSTKTTNRVVLRTDVLNMVKVTDTLVISESVCRGCAHEGSTYFSINDSTDNIVLHQVITKDNNPSDVAGGNISKTLILIPTRPGTTNFKLYKFVNGLPTAKDSAIFTRYPVEIKN